MGDGSMKDNTDRLHSLPVIFFHSLLDPVQHDPHKTIFIKICNKPLFFFRHRLFLRQVIPFSYQPENLNGYRSDDGFLHFT